MSPTRPILLLLIVLAPLLLSACTPGEDPEGGTAIGNPGMVGMALAVPDQLDVQEAWLFADGWALESCDGQTQETVEFTEGEIQLEDGVEWPAGTWCSATLTEADLAIFGRLEGLEDDDDDDDDDDDFELEDGEFYIELWMTSFSLTGPTTDGFVVAEDAELVIELAAPGWTSAEEIGLDEDTAVVVDIEEEVLHDELVDRVIEGTGLYEDSDGDWLVDPEEREAGALADTAEPEPPEEGDDDDDRDDDGMSATGCQTSLAGGEAPAGLLLLLLAAALRRRP